MLLTTTLRRELAELVSVPVRYDCRLDRYTSFGIGGPAAALVEVSKISEAQPLLRFLQENKLPWRIIGRGTNLLVADEGFAGVVLILSGEYKALVIGKEQPDGQVIVTAGGGCGLPRLALTCSDQGVTGLEFAIGIPGTVGGGALMNAGAWGSELGKLITAITVATADGSHCLSGPDLQFAYRCWQNFTGFQGRGIITGITLGLRLGDPAFIKATCDRLRRERELRQPKAYGSAGSFFKNPPLDSAGRLIDVSGLKGTRVGGAMVSEKHGNFFINTGSATAHDMFALMKLVQQQVQEKNGVLLEPEVQFL